MQGTRIQTWISRLLVIGCVCLPLVIYLSNSDSFPGQSLLCGAWSNTPHPTTTIYIITPTASSRNAQKADLTRLANTLRLVRNVHWVVVEDANVTNPVLHQLLTRSGIPFTHLATTADPTGGKGRGMGQRDLALEELRQRYAGHDPRTVDGVVFLADDDNAYDTRLFDEYIRRVKRVGWWPIAFAGNQWVESAVVESGVIKSWNTRIFPEREFAVDMAAFAIHLSLILQYPTARFGWEECRAFQYEPCFLSQLGGLKKEDMTVFGLSDSVSDPKEILVWHTQTKTNDRVLTGSKEGYIV